jgi:hypothetical protein
VSLVIKPLMLAEERAKQCLMLCHFISDPENVLSLKPLFCAKDWQAVLDAFDSEAGCVSVNATGALLLDLSRPVSFVIILRCIVHYYVLYTTM